MSTSLTATTTTADDPIALILILGSALVVLFLILQATPRARSAPGRPDARSARLRASAAAQLVEDRGRDLVFRCSRCKVRKLERGLAPGDYLERLIEQAPVCRECIDAEMALFEQDLAS